MSATNQTGNAATSKSIRIAELALTILVAVVLLVLLWLGVELFANNNNIQSRLITTGLSILLFFLKMLTHLTFGPTGSLTEKLRTFGSDMVFASLSFDVTAAFGKTGNQNVLATLFRNPEATAALFGIVSLFIWMFGLYRYTSQKTVHPWIVVVACVVGAVGYLGKLMLYL
ncbi:MAG TPA: hypothetical protein VK191_11200 [Symbiobacteriaceae bacterium]|nr:hypothetical protein [Symbiobacteriaceae bacterium]